MPKSAGYVSLRMKQSTDSLIGLFTCRLVLSVLARPQDPVRQVSNHVLDNVDLRIALVDDKTLPCVTEDLTYLATEA